MKKDMTAIEACVSDAEIKEQTMIREIQELKKSLYDETEQKTHLEKKVSDIQRLADSEKVVYDESLVEIEEKNRVIETLQRDIHQLKQKYNVDMNDKVQILTSQNEELQEELRNERKIEDRLQNDLVTCQNELSEVVKDWESIRKSCVVLQKRGNLNHMRTELSSLRTMCCDMNDHMMDTINALKFHTKQITYNTKSNMAKLNEKDVSLQQYGLEINELQSVLQERDKICSESSTESLEFQRRCIHLETQLNDIIHLKNSTEDALEVSRKDNEEMRLLLSSSQDEILKLSGGMSDFYVIVLFCFFWLL